MNKPIGDPFNKQPPIAYDRFIQTNLSLPGLNDFPCLHTCFNSGSFLEYISYLNTIVPFPEVKDPWPQVEPQRSPISREPSFWAEKLGA